MILKCPVRSLILRFTLLAALGAPASLHAQNASLSDLDRALENAVRVSAPLRPLVERFGRDGRWAAQIGENGEIAAAGVLNEDEKRLVRARAAFEAAGVERRASLAQAVEDLAARGAHDFDLEFWILAERLSKALGTLVRTETAEGLDSEPARFQSALWETLIAPAIAERRSGAPTLGLIGGDAAGHLVDVMLGPLSNGDIAVVEIVESETPYTLTLHQERLRPGTFPANGPISDLEGVMEGGNGHLTLYLEAPYETADWLSERFADRAGKGGRALDLLLAWRDKAGERCTSIAFYVASSAKSRLAGGDRLEWRCALAGSDVARWALIDPVRGILITDGEITRSLNWAKWLGRLQDFAKIWPIKR